MKIIDNPEKEFKIIINEIQQDLEYNLSQIIVDYTTKIFTKSISNNIVTPQVSKISIMDLYDLAEANLLRATILSSNGKEKDLFKSASYQVYEKIFEKYEDELSFEICSNFDKIENTLDGTKFYEIRYSIGNLLPLKEKGIPYVNRRLLKLRYLEIKNSDLLF